MRVVPVVGAVVAFAVAGGASAAPFGAKPPMIGGTGILPAAVAVDASGNRYVAGLYFDGADFDPGPGVQTRPVRAAGGDPFVTKFDATGKWVWTQTFGGTGNDQISGIAVNSTTVYACGSFESNDAGFGAVGSISAHYDATNFGAGFVIALDAATGAPQLAFNGTGAQIFGGTGGGRAQCTCVNAFGTNLVVGGSFTSFSFGIGGSGAVNSTGQTDGFVAKLDGTTGGAQLGFSGDGLQTFAGNGNETVRSVVQANSRVYVGGTMSSTNFGVGGVGSISSGAQYDEDAFLVCLQASNGNALASFAGDGIVTFGAKGSSEHGWCVAADAATAYLAGDADGAGAKIDGAGAAFPNIGGRDAFVLAVDAISGAAKSSFAGGVRFFGTTGSGPTLLEGTTTGLALSGSGVYVAGYLGGAGAGIGGPGGVEAADSFLLGLDAATGNALPGFAGDGVQTLTGVVVSGNDQPATTAGLVSAPDGLMLLGSSLAGGRVGSTALPAAGTFLLAVDPATGDALNLAGVSHRPVFAGPPVATPNPAVAGRPVKWKAFVADPDKNPLKLTWSFGDDTTSASKAPSKTYATPGTYTVDVAADDGKGGQTTSQGVDLVVLPAGTPYFDVAKLTVALKFPQAGKDLVTIAGQFPLADGTPLGGKTLTIDVGGVSQSFVLAATGRGATAAGTATVKAPKDGVAKFAASVHGDFAASLADEGLSADKATNKYAPTVATVTFDGVAASETYPLFWTVKSGKSGTAR